MKTEFSLPQIFKNLSKVDLKTYDLGNSRIKEGVFEKGVFKKENTLPNIPNHFPEVSVVTSVLKSTPSSFADHFKGGHFFEMPVYYSESLGHDRLVNGYMVFNEIKKETIVIDCGTFITIDYISPKGFVGGAILPGPKTLAEAYLRGNQLKEPEFEINLLENDLFSKPPQKTEDALAFGHQLLIRGLVREIQTLCDGRAVILTGGGSSLLHEALPQADICPNLIHYSMYYQYVKNRI